LTPGPSHLEAGLANAKLKKYKLPSSFRVLTELIQAGGKTLLPKTPYISHEYTASIFRGENI
jgi:hypothetical protein